MPKLAVREGKPAAKGNRAVYFGSAFQQTPVFDRTGLQSGGRINGPAIVEEFGSTTVVFPGQYVEVDPHGILVIRSVSSEPSRSTCTTRRIRCPPRRRANPRRAVRAGRSSSQ